MKTLICVPVYGGLDSVERCLDALAAATVAAERRVLLIDDASPDARIAPLLARYALTMANTQYRRNRSNRGFTWNVNQAFTAAQPDEAVCLLNSDTLVTTGWLDAMLGCLAEDERIRADVNRGVVVALASFVETQKKGVSTFIADQVKRWDVLQMTRLIELNVGRDLQFIRFNGMLIGGTVGLLLHAAERILLSN